MTFPSIHGVWTERGEWGRCHVHRCSHEFDLILLCSRPSCSSLLSHLSPHLPGGRPCDA